MVELLKTTDDPEGPDRVVVYHNDDGVPQPCSFSCCGRGVRLYHRHEIPLCELIEFTLEMPAHQCRCRRISCTGMVIECTFDRDAGLFHIHLQFIDLPDDARRHLEGLTLG